MQFKVDVKVIGFFCGLMVMQYEVEVGYGVKVEKIFQLSNNFVYVVVLNDVCILLLIFGKSVIGIEILNVDKEMVVFGDVFWFLVVQKSIYFMIIGVGKDVGGNIVIVNFVKMFYFLVVGFMGFGKFSFVNFMIISLLM